MYNLYRRLPTRDILRAMDASLDEAKAHVQHSHNFVEDIYGNRYNSLEELENAKDIRSEDRTWEDYFTTGGTEVFEDTDRELSEVDSDNSESSSERDN